jgi:Ala-tRNA(Pro) deacylase
MNISRFLSEQGVPFEILAHEPTYDSQHLAHALHAPGHMVAKTVLLAADHGYVYYVAVLPATSMVDLEAASKALGGVSLAMATEVDMGNLCPDCEVGAVPPFGSKYGMRTIVDESLVNDEWIVFEGNTHCEAIRMRFEDFADLEHPLVLSIAVPPLSHA